jgi:hypothetical protein
MSEKAIRVTRAGCLAVHLMPDYHGRKLSEAVKRIMKSGPRTEFELQAVRKANAETLPDPPIHEPF